MDMGLMMPQMDVFWIENAAFLLFVPLFLPPLNNPIKEFNFN
jgi:hypothetical protein